jgi:uncharacterized protein YbjT (DUF2867 family)
MCVLVTGALGNVGRAVVDACDELGLALRATDLDRERVRSRFPSHDAAALDFLDRATWAPALEGCDRVFLLRPPPIGDMERTLIPFVDAAYEAGVAHVVFLSVAGAEERSWVPHRKVELHLMARGRGYTILRPGFFAQNLEDAYRRDIVEDARLYVPAGRGRVAFVDVRDIGRAAARVLVTPREYETQALTLTGPRAFTFEEAARLLSETVDRAVRYEAASIPGYAWHLRVHRRMPWMQIAVQTILHVGLRKGDAEAVDPTLERILGERPRDLAQYVRDRAEVWRG